MTEYQSFFKYSDFLIVKKETRIFRKVSYKRLYENNTYNRSIAF